MTTPPADDAARSYHRGDLRRALLDAAVATIASDGLAALSLRGLARRVGVSHAAPAHHFGDKAGLLAAIAADGYRQLAQALRAAYAQAGSFLEVGVAYVRFAGEQRGYFEVMFRPDLYPADGAELVAARAAAAAALYETLRGDPTAGAAPDPDALAAGSAAWSLAHGLATLLRNRALPAALGDDPEEIARVVLAQLFKPWPLP